MRTIILSLACALLAATAFAQTLNDTPTTSPHSLMVAHNKVASKKVEPPKDKAPQPAAADKGKALGTIAAGDAKVKAALSATNLDAIKKAAGKSGSFVGTVADIYVAKSNKMSKLNFDPDFHKAISATIFSSDYTKLPDLQTLKGKKLLVTGKIEEYHGAYEIVVKGTDQIKIVK